MTIDDHKPRQKQKNANKCKTMLDNAKQSRILVFSGTQLNNQEKIMTYQYASTKAEAVKVAQAAKIAGRRAYILTLNATTYEIRSW